MCAMVRATQEIINGSKVISTPIIEAKLLANDSAIGARYVKAAIEKTTLGQVQSQPLLPLLYDAVLATLLDLKSCH